MPGSDLVDAPKDLAFSEAECPKIATAFDQQTLARQSQQPLNSSMFKRPTRQAIIDFLREEDGPTAVEYAVMLAMIVAVCIGAVNFLAQETKQSFDDSGAAISGAIN